MDRDTLITHIGNSENREKAITLIDQWKTHVDCIGCYNFHCPIIDEPLSWPRDVYNRVHKDEDPSKSIIHMFTDRMSFGTAGLRAEMGCGYNRMNLVTVMQTSQGVAKYYKDIASADDHMSVALGYDARHNSRLFAHGAAAVFRSYGYAVHMEYDRPIPTPLLAKSAVEYKTTCAVMITASHNPKKDNGYKLYGSNSVQIAPPIDMEISEYIQNNLEIRQEISSYLDTKTGLISQVFCSDKLYHGNDWEKLHAQFIESLAPYSEYIPKKTMEESDLKVVYTALHGMGDYYVRNLIQHLGFPSANFQSVIEQANPDPNFPTVDFPNPEEKHALDCAYSTAEKTDAIYVLSNDPDVDRFSASQLKGENWHQFTGDEVGVLLADYLDRHISDDKNKYVFTTTCVSSKMLKCFAKKRGYNYCETLTGFKFILNGALNFKNPLNQHCIPLLSYEEALGYCIGENIKDKDGIGTLGVFLCMAVELEKTGKTVLDRLDELKEEFGYFITNNSYVCAYDKNVINSIFMKFREGHKYLAEAENHQVTRIVDTTAGYDSTAKDYRCVFPKVLGSEMVTLYFKNTHITFRTSGTEPKIKWYSEIRGADEAEATQELSELVKAVVELVLKPSENNLKPAAA